MTTSQGFVRCVSSRQGAAIALACALAAFALRDLLAVDPRVLGADGLLEWFTRPTGVWLPFVLAASLWLAWRRRARWRALDRPTRPVASVCLCTASLAAALWARLTGVDDVLVFALLLLGAGLAALRGLRGVGVQALPLLFLLFAVAPPPRLMGEAWWGIQSGSARAATTLLHASGRPVLGEGISLTTPTEVFGVVESCTALGILVVLTAGAVLAREAIRGAGARSFLLVASAPAVALLLNLARITAIVLHPPLNRLHHLGQWAILLGLGALLLAGVARLLHRSAAGARKARATPAGPAPQRVTLAFAACAVAALLAATSLVPTPPPSRETPTPSVQAIPMQRGEWVATRMPVDSLFLGYLMFREVVSRRYERDGRIVDLFVGEAPARTDWSSPFSPKTLLPGLGWMPASGPVRDGGIELPRPPTQTAWIARDASRWWVAQWRFGDPGLLRDSLQQLLALDASPFGARQPRRVIRLTTPLAGSGPEGVAEAQSALASFADTFADVLFPEPNALDARNG